MPLDTARPAPGPQHPTATEIRRRLTHERDSRLAQIEVLEESAAGEDGGDSFVAAQRASVERVLKDVDIAFDHLAQGRYGICEGCTRPIPEERLEILPYARHCVACRQRAVTR
ncbi:TraR/DksA family transcriptional regulator [Streptomyces sp. NPDC058001]|uniref:TraR/DksA family transcriptional regulator n=1 Tax=Streptomyces sp. NPDC058001 TaxID=3346300 RepID=UPI0036F01ADF